ncbi:MAG: sulfur carrier protein ThiS [Candidatus Eremiobacteraeota bacterium]|nr:sulfur carrier protein ThiS [Candidatus Eremiobacteraeota bacterium]
MKATINGETRELPEGITVKALLDTLGAMQSGIAVARNDRVVRRAEYETQVLDEGDTIEIIRAVAGG